MPYKNKEEARLYRKRYYYKNTKKELKYCAEWIKNNKKLHDEYGKKSKQNPKNKIRRNKQRQLKESFDLNYKLKERLRNRIHSALKLNCKSKRTEELMGCNTEFFKNYIESKFKDKMSWDNYGLYGWHIDHIKPCASFDLSKEEEQKRCFHYSNLQPLWAKQNIKKRDHYSTTEEEFRNGLHKKAEILREEAEKELKLIGSLPK